MRYLFLLMLLLGCSFIRAQDISQTLVWPQPLPDDSIKEHFVYGLAVTKQGTILSFAEARLILGDASPHHIVMKRSLDNGANWEASQIIIKSENGSCYANPTPIVDSLTGAIYLFFARNYDNDSSDVFYITSKDDGLHWSDPIEVTPLFKNDPYQRNFHLPGPGHGIALSNGRLLLQVWHRHSIKISGSSRAYGVSTIYSDDHGKTWLAGNYARQTDSLQGNESRLLEISNGDVIMNARPGNSSKPQKDFYQLVKTMAKPGEHFMKALWKLFHQWIWALIRFLLTRKYIFLQVSHLAPAGVILYFLSVIMRVKPGKSPGLFVKEL
ncbi:glycoside hydrolase [Niabella ginsengisoli]|uniref:exo-alpha-sialidase n=1 Tax=Niabella ginsengisoli TaxID=522298 RepID=A0ABS9SN94_9BACT|nr:sialidase family protein [Niabella ginsengisoli]MCH5599815.1 glycoside hydrolase [Niabella ginsengisoli]